MKTEEFEGRARRAVAGMTDTAARRIAEADASSIAIALPSEQDLCNEGVAELRRLLHRLCRERSGLAA